jgi:2'-5' RNA ligase
MQHIFDFCRTQPIRPKRPERLFFGLFPDAETSRHIGRFGECFIRDHRLNGTRIGPDRLHVSLNHIGDYPRLRTKFIYAARHAGDAVSLAPFDMQFDAIMSFAGTPARDGKPRRRPLVMLGRAEALSELHQRLGTVMERNGLRGASPAFTPHMTLLYGPEALPRQAIEPIRFAVREFTLIHSERGLSRYNMLGRWRLKG